MTRSEKTAGLTLLEVLMAVSISVILFAAFIGGFRVAQETWESQVRLSHINSRWMTASRMFRNDVQGLVCERTATPYSNRYADAVDGNRRDEIDLRGCSFLILRRSYRDEFGQTRPSDILYLKSASANPSANVPKWSPVGEVMYYLGYANNNGDPSDDLPVHLVGTPYATESCGAGGGASGLSLERIHLYRAVNYSASQRCGPKLPDQRRDDEPLFETQLIRNVIGMEISVRQRQTVPVRFIRGPFVWPNADPDQEKVGLVRIALRLADSKLSTSSVFTGQYTIPSMAEF